MSLSRLRCARIGIKLLLGMTQPPPAPLIDLKWSVYEDFTTSLVETGEQEKWQLLGISLECLPSPGGCSVFVVYSFIISSVLS